MKVDLKQIPGVTFESLCGGQTFRVFEYYCIKVLVASAPFPYAIDLDTGRAVVVPANEIVEPFRLKAVPE